MKVTRQIETLIKPIALLLICVCAREAAAKPAAPRDTSPALKEYLSRQDGSYTWTVRTRGKLGSGSYAELILTSQTWHDIVWKHQLFIYRPGTVKDATQGLLLIDGGSWKDELEAKPDEATSESLPEKAMIFATLADIVQSPVAILRQVPRQPIFDGRKEDQIIALTFSKYLETGESDWPLLLPMVKSAVRAMDAVQEFANQEWQMDIEHFMVTGASKRGWTTWLTAASDPRVNALAPIVINMLNMAEHDKLQLESFGTRSEEIRDYTELKLHEKMMTPEGQRLRGIVDPYAYRDRLLQPKLIILGTNDAYWPVDSLNLYWNELQGDKYILYVPNNGHGIRDYPRVVSAVAALQRSITGGKPLPKLAWQLSEQPDQMQLELTSDVTPSVVRRWTAVAETRDFRKAEWKPTTVRPESANDRRFVARLEKPAHGYQAMFLEAEFSGSPVPFDLSTTLHVIGGNGSSSASGDSAGGP